MAEDVRRRRAERVKRQRLKTALPRYGKYVLIAVVIVAAVAAAAVFYKPAPGKLFAHEHPSFAMFIHGQEVSFNDAAYDIANIRNHVHMHILGRADAATASHTWHVEASFPAGIPDLTLQHIFAQYGLSFSQGYLKLDTHADHNGSEWRDAGEARWRVFVSKIVANATGNERQPFTELTGDYTQAVPRDGDRILVTYGALTPEEVTRQQNLVPEPQP